MSGTYGNSVLENLGRRIRNTRVSNGMSQAALARMCGITFQQVQKYEMGKTRIPIDRLVSVAAALDLSVTELVRDLDQEPAGAVDDTPLRSQKQAVALLKHFNTIQDETVRASLLALIKSVANLERAGSGAGAHLLAPDGDATAAYDALTDGPTPHAPTADAPADADAALAASP
ncbi:Transcriptional regulator, contains XRE-family HTH domain [Limimonas halophila]|uniref:Transcriptional regulator, contains XRE-family HTH domain n=1 Tax=Limimonas halophila TaxID=1082479 RepID=A0A1G7S116_9PROT|nr:helix-turn-helix transcriptional regulator [Limimonas halophila]SDG16681.1 Transcriptional regulator, contains XRE-family HTH domain [Limimonas halophila]